MKTGKNINRFREAQKYIHEFADEFLVVCPNCSQRAEVLPAENTNFNPANHLFLARKLVCPNCGHNRKWHGKTVFDGSPFDWYFQQTLWLQIECCGETLWAYNEKHLQFIENYVAAKLRERVMNKNSSIASRLPQWIKSAKNRGEILKAIEKLKVKLPAKAAE